jgi:hypothetical protein
MRAPSLNTHQVAFAQSVQIIVLPKQCDLLSQLQHSLLTECIHTKNIRLTGSLSD